MKNSRVRYRRYLVSAMALVIGLAVAQTGAADDPTVSPLATQGPKPKPRPFAWKQ